MRLQPWELSGSRCSSEKTVEPTGGFCGCEFPGIYPKMNEEGIKLLQRNDGRKYVSQKRPVEEGLLRS